MYVDDNGVDLGRWLAQIRMFRKNGIRSRFLSDERIKALDDIGMIWDVFDYIWEEYYSAAVKYHRKHGDLNVPARYVDSDGIKLGQWLNNLRSIRNGTGKGYRELTDEQITRLDSLGMIWGNKLEMRWKNAFQALCKYHKEYGTFDVKCNFKTEDGINLGKWVRDQRDIYASGKLSEERIEKLRGIGFVLEKSDPWEEKYRLAKDYYEEHGDLNVPFDYVASGVWLNKWLNEQKQIAEGKRKKQLSSEQLTKLEEIGFRYGATLYEQQWNERYDLAKAYNDEYGNLDIPKDYCVGDFQLGKWIRQQKSQYKAGAMPEGHIKRLSDIGMVWDNVVKKNAENSYITGFRHLEEFITENGVKALSGNIVCKDGYNLGNWLANCKTKYRNEKLAKKHIIHFQQLGISFEAVDSWEERYQDLKSFLTEHNMTSVPKSTIDRNGYDLYYWVSDQRRAYKSGKLTQEQMQKLDDIGYPFYADSSSRQKKLQEKWMKNYEIVLEYSEAHKGEHTPKAVVYKGVSIVSWLSNQQVQFRKGKMIPERIELLKKIKINSFSFETDQRMEDKNGE